MKIQVTIFERPAPDTEAFRRGDKPQRLKPQPLPHVEHPTRASDAARAEIKAFLTAKGWKVCSINSTDGGRAADGEMIPAGLVVYVERKEKE